MNGCCYIYRASAGSGKTRALVKAYLKLALSFEPNYFKHILVVTFTNKATREMRERILQYLEAFSRREFDSLADELQHELGFSADRFQRECRALLSTILHQYTWFSVATIDSFFQRVMRSFAQETGLLGGFQIEIEDKPILEEAIERLIDNLSEGDPTAERVIDFARERLQQDKSPDIRGQLLRFAQDALKDEVYPADELFSAQPTDSYAAMSAALQREVSTFENYMRPRAEKALALLAKHHIGEDDLKGKSKSVLLKYLKWFTSPDREEIPKAPCADAEAWYRKEYADLVVLEASRTQILPVVQDMMNYEALHTRGYHSARCVMKNRHSFGLLADILRTLRDIKEQKKLILISESPRLVNRIINESDTPMIYEKIGSYFRHYLIDEFQDTSRLQWKNFFPLLKESVDQGLPVFLVGDVKQSIYRFRGGDPQLLSSEVEHDFGPHRVQVETLRTNYRSAARIIEFNNALFAQAAPLIDAAATYSDVEQQSPSAQSDSGYVGISFLENTDHDWKDRALACLPPLIEKLQDRGIGLGDIAILTYRREEGRQVMDTLMRYKSQAAKPGYRYDCVSEESLRVDASPAVQLIVAALQYLCNPSDALARAMIILRLGRENDGYIPFGEAAPGRTDPWAFSLLQGDAQRLATLSPYEAVEELIRRFQLAEDARAQAYLLEFQKATLEFTQSRPGSLSRFLEWWEEQRGKKQVARYAANAINLLTIHKAKGLQFKYVILPQLDWGLDHQPQKKPLLWVKSDQEPFRQMGRLTVKYTKDLKKTYFEVDYNKERSSVYLDRFNMLYVALTRAQEGLIAFAPMPKDQEIKDDAKTTAVLVYKSITGSAALHGMLCNDEFTLGELPPLALQKESNQPPAQSPSAHPYVLAEWRKTLKPRKLQYSDLPWTGFMSEDARRGQMVHAFLSRVRYKDDVRVLLDEFSREHALPAQVQGEIGAMVDAILTDEVASAWFEKKWDKVDAEVSLLLPGGKEQRIDRIMMTGAEAVVVDYKVGVPEHRNRVQVEGYMHTLSQMGYRCAGYLLYLDPLKVVYCGARPAYVAAP